MMDNQKWLLDSLNQLEKKENRFAKRALLQAAKKMVREQNKRIEQAEGELDGRIWSPYKW